ncbi:MAG: hypothetical protein IT287_09340 [Bdellovibrionaceae bacterium]|nr:hypothetical protein [Pseudobdellovibrionaceae bacterium]
MKKLVFLIATLLQLSAIAQVSAPSAVRKIGESWQSKIDQSRIRESYYGGNDVLDAAEPFSQLDTTLIPKWTDEQQLQKSFEYVRDIAFMQDFTYDIEWRRSTWLYPDDGCYARAALAADHLVQTSLSTAKIFVFGDLEVETQNASSGYVQWWFHVAPIVYVGKDLFVLDPALNPKSALPVKEWLGKMGNIDHMTVSICTSTAYEPYSPCKVLSDSSTPAKKDQSYFLDDEWERLLHLGRHPLDELGSKPPWL